MEVLNPPQNADEVMKLMAMLLETGQLDEAAKQLDAARVTIGPALSEELAKRIAVRRMTS